MAFLYMFPNGTTAVFERAAGSGDVRSYDADVNAPAKYPMDHLDKVLLHSDFDYFPLLAGPTDVTVSLGSVAGVTGSNVGTTNIIITPVGQTVPAENVLITFEEQDTPPRYKIAYQGAVLTSGTEIQSSAGGRFVTHYATTTQIILVDVASSTNETIGSMSSDFEVVVFGSPEADPSKNLGRLSPDATYLARGKIDISKPPLRRVRDGESSFDINLGPTMDIKNGAITVRSGGNTYAEAGYDGSFSGPDYVPIGLAGGV